MCRWRRCAIRTRPLGRGQWARTAGGGGTASAETVRQALAGKRLLLVLDNLEQVAEAAPFVGDLVSASPELRVLATSRLPLRLRAEHEYPVLPLGLPPRHAASPEEILCFEAVRLFVERAQTVKPGFILTPETAPGRGRDRTAPGRAAAGHRAGGSTGTHPSPNHAPGAAGAATAAADRWAA